MVEPVIENTDTEQKTTITVDACYYPFARGDDVENTVRQCEEKCL